MGKSLNDLGLRDEALPEGDLENLPEFGSFTPPPQPGAYRFKFPGDMSTIWDVIDAKIDGKDVQRVKAVFDKDHPLMIVSSVDGKSNGLPYETRLTNVERKRGKRDGDGPVASDLDYLLKAFGVKDRPKSNRAMAQAIQTLVGKEFGGDVEYSWICGENRNIRALNDPNDPNAGTREVENQKGCGKKYYAQDVQKGPDGTTPLQIQCQCGAILRAFANLKNFRA